ncbi:hypothetical protein N7468_006593 [Penicillium chermesinum]|uniref:Mpv17/PMP22 n=1 Tax=Penicillium chermesinum TaxID=63820 RepID=A0A9W9NUY1_9EURO|nr:uncharacterized protein N7468_006593 [Penicillium chermesinum]KAJ5225368.1 hypothetical protein N7468_006593 [Penicillium chermesinum]
MLVSPLTVTFVQSTILNALSNILAQLIDQHINSPKPFSLNTLALLQYVTYGILIVPINFYWQRALEARYPGFPTRAEIANAFRFSGRSCSPAALFRGIRSFFSFAVSSLFTRDPDDQLPSHKEREKDKDLWAPRARRSGLHCFVMKFFLDLTVASGVNIVLFVVLINLLKGESLSRTWELIFIDFRPIMSARLKYRPLVSTLMYTVIPVDRRVVFGSACGVIWGVYLSLYAVV